MQTPSFATAPRAVPFAAEAACRARRAEGGFSLLEIGISIGVLAIALMGLMFAMTTAIQVERDADEQKRAREFAVSMMEQIRSMDYDDLFAAPPTGFMIPTSWSGTSELGAYEDTDKDGDPEWFGRAFYANSGKQFKNQDDGTVFDLDDPLLQGLTAVERPSTEIAYQRVGAVIFTDVVPGTDEGTTVAEGEGYRVTIVVQWQNSQRQPVELKLATFVTDK